MSPRIVVLSVLGLLGVLAACTNDDAAPVGGATTDGGAIDSSAPLPNPANPPAPASPANASGFCDKTLGIIVTALEQCCTADDKTQTQYKLTHDVAAYLKPVCASALSKSAMAGRVTYRSDRADACYSAYAVTYAAGKCGNITETFSDPAGTACREAFVGTVPSGGACGGDHECLDGLTCVGYTSSADGTCKTPPAIGEVCGAAPAEAGASSNESSLEFGTHPSCAGDATCDAGKCVAGTSKTKAAEGAPCTGNDCAPGLYCPTATHTCAKKESAGAPCTGGAFSSECAGRCASTASQPGTCATFCGSR